MFFKLQNQFILVFMCAVLFVFSANSIAWSAELPIIDAKSYVLMDEKTGAILVKQKEKEALPPASMTKMMSALVVLDEIQKGNIQWTDNVTVSARAAGIEEAQIKIAANDKITVKELFTAMLVYSANDATVALAEYVGKGTEEAFVAKMNAKANEINMKNSHFRVSTGLDMKDYPDPPDVGGEHKMSAEDTGILADELVSQYPEVLKTTGIPNYTFFPGVKDRELKKVNWNQMLQGLPLAYPGVDGLKTGHTNAAGYCFTGTVKHGQQRFISVVMGAPIDVKRFSETKKLYDYGYAEFERKTLIKQNHSIPKQGHLSLPNGVDRTVPIVNKDAVEFPIHKGKAGKYSYQVTFKKGLKAPLAKGAVVGEAQVLYEGQAVAGLQPYDLITYQPIEEGSDVRLFFRQVGDKIASWF